MPGTGLVQRRASSLFTRVPTLAERDQHKTRFVLQIISLWPNLRDYERVWAFQRLNVYCIVAALGWPAATATCASSTATTDFVLPPGVVLPQQQQQQGQRRNRRDQQPAAAAPQPAAAAAPPSQQQQRRGRNRRNTNPEEMDANRLSLILLLILALRP